MKQAVIYARFSPRKNAEDSESNEMQKTLCGAFCAAKQWEIVGCFEDQARSGGSREGRPGLENALRAAEKHKAALVVYSLCRLARSTRDACDIADQLRSAGADLVSVKESFDTTTSTGTLIFQVLAAIAEFERRQISERTADAMNELIRSGHRMNMCLAKIPFGWKPDPNDDKRIIRDEERIEAGRLMEALQKQDLSLAKIAKSLNELGVRRSPGKPREWSAPSIWRALKAMRKWWPEE